MRTVKIKEITYGSGTKRYLPIIYIETTETETTREKVWFHTVTTTKQVKKTKEYRIAKHADGTFYEQNINVHHFDIQNPICYINQVNTYDEAINLIKKLDADIEARKQQALANTIIETKLIDVK